MQLIEDLLNFTQTVIDNLPMPISPNLIEHILLILTTKGIIETVSAYHMSTLLLYCLEDLAAAVL